MLQSCLREKLLLVVLVLRLLLLLKQGALLKLLQWDDLLLEVKLGHRRALEVNLLLLLLLRKMNLRDPNGRHAGHVMLHSGLSVRHLWLLRRHRRNPLQ